MIIKTATFVFLLFICYGSAFESINNEMEARFKSIEKMLLQKFEDQKTEIDELKGKLKTQEFDVKLLKGKIITYCLTWLLFTKELHANKLISGYNYIIMSLVISYSNANLTVTFT